MSNKKYYHSEVIEFQNEDKTVARQLTIKRLRILNELFVEHDTEQKVQQKRIEDAIAEALKADKNANAEEVAEAEGKAITAEGGKTYLDTLAGGTLIALTGWGVKDKREKSVEVDSDYVEEHLDYPTMIRICEIAGSMELGDTSQADDSGKA